MRVKNNDRYGSVNIKNNFITDFIEKKNIVEESYINSGVYYLSPLDFIKYSEKIISLEKSFLPALCKKKNVKAVYLKTDFIDIGIPKDYLRFVHWINNDKKGEL